MFCPPKKFRYIYNIYIIYIYIRCFYICSFSFSRPNFRSRCPLDRLNSVALVEALGHSHCHEEVTETLTGKISGTHRVGVAVSALKI